MEQVQGSARFLSPETVEVALAQGGTKLIAADYYIIAAGSRPAVLPLGGNAAQEVMNSDGLLDLPAVPARMLLIGGGVIGVEFAALYSSFGTAVHIVEFLPSILSNIDTEVAQAMKVLLEKKGIAITTNAAVTAVNKNGDTYSVTVEPRSGGPAEKFETGCVAVAAGRVPNIENLGLDKADIAFSKKGISTDDTMKTSRPNIFAIGDIAGKYQLAHTAAHEGMIAAENITGIRSTMHYNAVPACVYTTPEIACAGITEEQAQAQNINYAVGKFPFSASGRALTYGNQKGFIKLITDTDSGKIIGAHMIGPHVSELLPETVLAMNLAATPGQIANSIHAHPTLSEATMEAALASLGRALSI